MAPLGAKNILMNFPNRDELLFRIVWALPKASKIGLACKICRSSRPREDVLAIENRSISSASLPLNEDDRGRPDAGALDERDEDDEELGKSGEIVALAIAARY